MRKPSNVLQLEEIRNRLREAEETLSAIRNGEVDSLIVTGPHGSQVFSLRGAEQPYRVFVEQMQQGAVTMTADGTVLYVNRRMAELLNRPLERVIGLRFDSFLAPEDHAAFGAAIADTTPGRNANFMLRREDGEPVPASLSISRMPMEDVDAVCIVVTDLTEHEQKRELALALERLTAVQDQLRVQNEELSNARKAADAANDAKDEFLATLSHELRTPLTPVLVGAYALEQDPALPEYARADLAMMRRNIELEARLIDDLLDLTRIVRGKVELRIDDVNVHSVLTDVLEICAADAYEGRIRLVREFAAVAPIVRGDAVRIQQILWNLVRNALKFTPAGGLVTLRTGETDGFARIEVIDTGIGMNAETLQRIFSPFEQAGREITRRFGGLGLGLAISRRLTELHGGAIEAHSEGTGRGSSFATTLPLSVSAAKPSKPAAKPKAGGKSRRLRILLVEDHADTRRSMTRILSSDHDIEPVDSVAAALAHAAKHDFDLLISDVGLPDGTGHDLMRELRTRYGEMVGICLSGYGMAEDIVNSQEAGFARHLTKPVSITALRAAIVEISPKLGKK